MSQAAVALTIDALLPAMTVTDKGCREWHLPDGRLHRLNGPARVGGGPGVQEWWIEGKRIDFSEWCDSTHFTGEIEWGENGYAFLRRGKLHRNGDLPALEVPGVVKEYWTDGKRNRAGNKPAVIEYGAIRHTYYVDDQLHRTNGPARIYANGKKEYWTRGKQLTFEEWREDVDTDEGAEFRRLEKKQKECQLGRSRTSLLAN